MKTKIKAFFFIALAILFSTTAAWSAEVSLSGTASSGYYINMPSGTDNILDLTSSTVTKFNVYDNGGSTGSYTSNFTGALTITVPNNRVPKITGSIKTEAGWDKLTIYDGTTTSGDILVDAVSGTKDVGPVAPSDKSVTIYFHSDGSNVSDGFDLTVELIDASVTYSVSITQKTGGSLTASKTTATYGTVISLTPTLATDYMLDGISVLGANDVPVKVNGDRWYAFDVTPTFKMPLSNVRVVPSYISKDNWTATGGLSINVPATGTLSASIPAGVQSFKVYDDGGYSTGDGGSSYNSSGYLKLTAPEGCVFQVKGSVVQLQNLIGYLTIYDGEDNEADKLVDMNTSADGRDIGTHVSSGNKMTIYFHNGDNDLDLDVTVAQTSVSHEIAVSDGTTGGSVAVVGGITEAAISTNISLVLDPDEGYLPIGVDVVAEDGQVKVNMQSSFMTEASFSMPYSDVTITPVYTSVFKASAGLYHNLPTTTVDPQNITIPEGVESFKLYDDGGADGYGSKAANGVTVLTAPEGKIMKFDGSATSIYLNLYNGNEQLESARFLSVGTSSRNVEDLYSTSNVVTISNVGYEWGNGNVDFTVTLVDASVPHDVDVATVSGGSIEGISEATYGETVSLTAIPDEDYALIELNVVDEKGRSISLTRDAVNQNKYSFTMPYGKVTVTPRFANPKIATFDSDGALNNGTYFHMECENRVCVISQGVSADPTSETDFKYWYRGTMHEWLVCDKDPMTHQYYNCQYGLVDYLEQNYSGYSVKLADTLRFGGYKDGKCAMQFEPFTDVSVDGNGYAIDGLCQKNKARQTGLVYANTQAVTVENIALLNVHIEGASGQNVGVIAGNAAGGITISNVKVNNSDVTGSENVGGFVGYSGGDLLITKSYYDGDVTGSGTSAVVGGLVGSAVTNGTTVTIKNTYSVGEISGTTAGYIIGKISYAFDDDYVFNNYHFGSDAVVLGVATVNNTAYDNDVWTSGSSYIFGNVRNAYTGMTANAMNLYQYYTSGETVPYMDFFSFSCYEGSCLFNRNGVAREADMKSDKFAALLNTSPVSPAFEAAVDDYGVWYRSDYRNEGLPVFVEGSLQPNRMVTIPVQESANLTEEQKNSLGVYTYVANFSDGSENYASAMVGYTDSTGNLSDDFKGNVESLIETVDDNFDVVMLVDNQGRTVSLDEQQISSNKQWRLVLPATYTVVYQYCVSNVCDAFEDVTDRALLFLSPKVDEFTNDATEFLLIPNVVSLTGPETEPWATGLSYTVEFQKPGAAPGVWLSVDEYGGMSDGTIWSFADIAQKIMSDESYEDVSRVIIKYKSRELGDKFPEIVMHPQSASSYLYKLYGEDADGGEALVHYSSAAGMDENILFAEKIQAYDYEKKTGYKTLGTYTATYKYDAYNETNCTTHPKQNFVVTEKNFGEVDALLEAMGECATVSWTIGGEDKENYPHLGVNDKVVLSNVRTARSVAASRNTNEIKDTLIIAPDYEPINYNVTFNFALPSSETDNSFIFVGRNWKTSGKYTVEGPYFPKVYTTRCPTMPIWWPTEGAQMPFAGDWYYHEREYAQRINGSFLANANLAEGEFDITAYPYWNTQDSCTGFGVLKISYEGRVEGKGHETGNIGDFRGTVILTQVFGDHTISHSIDTVTTENSEVIETPLPLVDDTLSFGVSMKPYPGYFISNLVYSESANNNSGINPTTETGVTLGFNADDATLVVNPAMLTAINFDITFDYLDYKVIFARPIGDNVPKSGDDPVEFFVADSYVGSNWKDSLTYTVASSDKQMPAFYAMNGCIGWLKTETDGTTSIFKEFNDAAAETFSDRTELVSTYFTPEDDANLCAEVPTETFTVTARAGLNAEHLTGMELWQFVAADHADTIKHTMNPVIDNNDEDAKIFSIEIPKVTVTSATGETSIVPFTFEIHAITEDGFTTTSNSCYRMSVQEASSLRIPYENGTLTTNGNNVNFFVDLMDASAYSVAFETENWDKIQVPNADHAYKYALYIADEDLNSFESYSFGEMRQRLPVLYAASFEEPINKFTRVIAGWTFNKDKAYCVVDGGNGCVTSSGGELFTHLSGDLLVAALTAADNGDITIKDNVIKLYPVWDLAKYGDVWYSGANSIQAGCPEGMEGCGEYDHPMTVTLSQTFTLNGEPITLSHTFDGAVEFPWVEDYKSITLDVDYKANPGYELSSIKLENTSEDVAVYDGTNKKLHMITHTVQTSAKLVPVDLTYVDYTVTFDIRSLQDSVVVLGKSWYDRLDENGQLHMNVGTATEFPNLYVRADDNWYKNFNYAFWANAVKQESDFDDYEEYNEWCSKFVNTSQRPEFDSELLGNLLEEDPAATAMTVYPLPVADVEYAVNAYYMYINLWSDEGYSDEFHGSVVLSQTWNGLTFKQKSWLTSVDGIETHALLFPDDVVDDTLTFDVSFEPDPGYEMELDGSNLLPDGLEEEDGWGYNPEKQTLKLQPSKMFRYTCDMAVRYRPLHYNVRYTIPENTKAFVANQYITAEDSYVVDWFDTLLNTTAETINSKVPLLYMSKFDESLDKWRGCRVDWTVEDSEDHENKGIVNELVYMKTMASAEDVELKNILIPDENQAVCDSFSSLKQTLTVEGKGSIHFEQVLDVTPVAEGDPEQAVIKHSFENSEDENYMQVPAIHRYASDGSWTTVGFKVRVVAEPGEGYTFDSKNAITYEKNVDGNHETIVVEDSSFVNLMRPLAWNVKFSKLAPIYVTYDLSLTSADDSANTYLPPEATTAESLELASNTDTVAFWKPFQVGTCFQGWSTTAAANYTADNSAYTTFNAGNFTEFSTNPDNPTKLYAIWGDNCPENRKFWTVENETKKVKLVLYQLFGGDTLFHEVSNDYGLALEGEAFDVYVDPVKSTPKTGYRYAEDAKFSLKYQYELPLAEGSDPASETVEVEPDDENGGVWHLTSVDIPSPIYTFSTNVTEKDYLFVLDVNAGDASVFYGTDWTKKMTLTVSSNDKYFPSRLRRTDACFEGWDLVASMGNGPYSGLDDAIHVLNDIVPNNGTFITDAGEEENRDYYPLYAMWDESCEPSNYTLTTEVPASQGSFRMVQKVDDVVYAYTLDGDHPLTLPNDYTVEYDTVSFVPAAGHTLATGAQISVIYNAEDLEHGIHTFANASKYHFSDSANSEGTAVLEISSLSSDDYVLVFTENVGEGEDKPFLGDSWADFITEASFAEDANGNWTVEIGYSATSENKKFPTALYRNGKCLTGYTFAAGDNTDGVYTELSDEFMLKYAELGLENPVTLYPYWEDCDNVYTVTASDADQGVLTLKQKFAKGETEIVREYTVGAAGIALSSTNDDVTFSEVNFEPNEGSSLILDTERDYSSRADAEAEWATLAVPFTVTSNMEIKAPLLLQANFALDANAEGVFYGPDFSWNWSSENVAYDAVLPKNLYRAGYNLVGWKFKGEKDDAAKLRYDDSFAAAYMAYQAAHEGAAPDTLHAVWSRAGQVGVYTLQVSNAMQESNAGTLTFSQTIGDSTVVSTIEGGSLLVPAVEGLQLTANFAIDTAHTFDGEEPISLLSVQGNVLGTYANEGTITFDETFGAPGATIYVDVATTVDSYTFTFVVNTATEDTVFYGSNWVGKKTFSMADEANLFPTSIYQTGKCLAGYAFKSTGTTTYTGIDAAFVADYKSRASKPKKLYAIWTTPETDETCSPVNVTVKSGNSGDQGVFTLTNADNTFTVSEETAITVPVAEDLDFNVTFTAQSAFGDYGDKDITVVIGKTTTKFVNGEAFKFSDPTYEAILKADVESKAVEFALNANAGDANVFYGASYQSNWTSTTAEYDDAFPSSIYRTDAEFAGWAFTETATVGFTKFDNDFMAAYAEASAEGETAPTTLYAVWIEPETEIETATITSKSLDEGNFVVAQFVGEDSIGYSVGADGVVVPLNADLEFKAYFKADADHSLASISTPINLYVDGEETASAKIANGGVFTVTGDVAVEANTAADCYEFVFNVNAGEETVFYGSSWNESMLSTDETKAFPTSAYRTDKCLNGFAFEAENPTVTYNEISDEFLTTFKESGIPSPATLYAVWSECETTPEVYTVNVKNTLDEGAFTLLNEVDGISKEYKLDKEHSLTVPAASDLKFYVSFNANNAFAYTGNINIVDLSGDVPVTLDEIEEGDAYRFTQSATLEALTTFGVVEFAYDLNAGNANVFLASDFEGLDWNVTAYGDAFPAKMTRTDKVFAGWAFTRDATVGYTAYDNEFVAAYEEFSAGRETPEEMDTLYAVWAEPEQPIETYNVVLSTLNAGVLTLSQSVAGVTQTYEVDPVGGIEIPVNGNLEYSVLFTSDFEHTVATGTPITITWIVDDLGNTEEESIANGGQFEFKGKSYVAVALDADKYELVFNVNAASTDTVFYGSEWFAKKTYDMGVEESRAFPTSIYQNGKCLAGFAFKKKNPDAVFTEVGQDFVNAYKSLSSPTKNLYAVWTTEDCDQTSVTVASANTAAEGNFTLTDAKNDYVVSADAPVTVPVAEDLGFRVAFVSGDLYKDYDSGIIGVKMGGKTAYVGNGDHYLFTVDAQLSASVTPKTVVIALDANAGSANVFYGKDYTGSWSSKNVDFDGEALLPTEGLYRTDAVLAGWAFTALADNSEEGVFTKFDKDFMAAYAAAYAEQETAPATLYAVWKTETERTTYTIASGSLDEGSLVVSQIVGEDSIGYAVSENGLTVPAESGLEFKAYFVANEGYSLAALTKPLDLYLDGSETPSKSIANGGVFEIQDNTTIKANTSSGEYEVVFDANAGDAAVFYGEAWITSIRYDMSASEIAFPTSLYRTDKCLAGFAFDAENATTAYRELDDDFMKAFKEGEFSSPMTLYAVWDECSGDRENYTVTVENTAEEGKFVLTNAVGDIKAVYELDGSFTVPAGEDLKFAVHFEANGAYSYNNAIEVLASNGVDDIMLEQLEDGAKYGFGESVRLKAETDFSVVEFAYDLNANGANVFFSNDFEGLSWTVASYGDAFPTKIYRTGKKLAGFAFTRDATVAYTAYDNDFVSAYKEFAASREESETLDTLYAVWTADDETGTYTVTSAGTNVGVLTLSQSVSGFGGSYEIGSTGLEIPAVENLEFSMSFVADYQYTVASGKPLKLSWTDAMGVVLKDSVANGGVYEFTASTVVSVNMAADVYKFAFDVNAESADTVFYGTNWFANKTYDLGDEELAREFPTSIYQTDKCLVGYAFESTASEENVFTKLDTDFIVAYKALDVKPKKLYAVWTTPEADETCAPAYVTLSSDNATEEAVFTVSDAYNSYVVEPGVTINVPKASDLMLKVSYSIGRGYNLYAASLLDESGDSYGYLLDNTEYCFDVNTVLHADVTVKSVGVVFAMNAGDAAVFYGKDFVRDWNIADVEFGEALPVNVYRTDAKLAGWSLRPLPGVAEEGVYASVDEAFIAAFKKHVESRESFDTPDTLYAVWKTVNNRPTYTVSMANRASEGSFVLANGAAGFGSNEYVIDGSRTLEVPAESDLLFTVEFKQSSEKARYHAISVLPLDSENPVGYLASGDEFNFKSDVRLRAMNVIDAIEFALDVNANGKNVFFGRDFREFKWTASAYGQELPTGIYRADAKLAGWSFNKKAKPEQAFTTFDDAFEEAYEKACEKLLETGLMEESLGGNLDWSNIQERYGMDFTQVRTPVLYAVWESATVETKQIVSKSLKRGTLSIVQKVGDSTFTYVVDEKGMKVPSVTDDELMVIAHFESDPAWLLMGEKPLIWKTSTGADTTENDFVGMLNEMPKKVTFSVIAKYIGFHLVFNVDSKETSKEKLFYGDDWVAEDDVTASEHAVLPAVVYSANRCLAGWSVSSKSKSLYTTMNDNLANEIYTAYPNLDETTKVPLYARWSQNVEDCAGYFTRISVEHDKDKVMFIENRDGKEVVHNFNNRGTMLLPEDIVSFDWTLRTAPDSSFMLDSLLMFRGEKIVAKLTEGSQLPGNMEDVVLVPFFGKSNKTPITLVEKSFAQSGNAVQMSFKASEFEVTRKASARVQLIDTTTNVVILDSLLGDSVAMGYADDVVLHVTKPGDYRVVVTIGDEKESDEYDGFFSIKSQIASVAKDSWQMISLAAVDTSALKWDNDQVFYWWDEQGTGDFWQYKRYYRGDEIVKERGAWYSSLKARPLVLRTDLEEDREDIVWELDSVSTGWNLVANPYGWDVSLFSNRPDADKAFDEQSEVTFWRYNAQTSDYEEVHYLKPYEAVWAKVSKKMTWKVSSAPVFNAEEPALESEAPEAGDTVAFEKRILAKASTKDRWTLQAVLSDKNGRQDAWNILGAGNNPFSAEEPPSSMGDHVNFAILDNKKTLAKSIKESSDEMEWTVALSASSDRVGYLKLAGIEGVKAFGYRVYVTVDGNTTEMQENVPLTVYLKSSVKTATVRVAPTARTVVTKKIDGLRTTRLGNRLQVSFNVSEGLAGEKTRVDLMDMKGHIVSTVSAQALNGSNALMLDLPKSGLYMIRVRAGSQQQATKIAVK